MEGIKLNSTSVLEAKKKLDAEYAESVGLNEWINPGTSSLSSAQSGTQVIDGVVSGISPKVEIIFSSRPKKSLAKRLTKRHKKLSKARIKRASVRGKLLMLNIFGKGYGKVVRQKRHESYYCFDCDFVHTHPRAPHPRRALIVTKSGITPVRLKGK